MQKQTDLVSTSSKNAYGLPTHSLWPNISINNRLQWEKKKEIGDYFSSLTPWMFPWHFQDWGTWYCFPRLKIGLNVGYRAWNTSKSTTKDRELNSQVQPSSLSSSGAFTALEACEPALPHRIDAQDDYPPPPSHFSPPLWNWGIISWTGSPDQQPHGPLNHIIS